MNSCGKGTLGPWTGFLLDTSRRSGGSFSALAASFRSVHVHVARFRVTTAHRFVYRRLCFCMSTITCLFLSLYQSLHSSTGLMIHGFRLKNLIRHSSLYITSAHSRITTYTTTHHGETERPKLPPYGQERQHFLRLTEDEDGRHLHTTRIRSNITK